MNKLLRENKQLQQKFCKLSGAFLTEPVPESVWGSVLPVRELVRWIKIYKNDNTCNLGTLEVLNLMEDVTMLTYKVE